MYYHETHLRSLAKALSFRLLVLAADFVIIMALTHRYDLAIGMMIFSNISSTLLYFLHERVWNGIKWGVKIVKSQKLKVKSQKHK